MIRRLGHVWVFTGAAVGYVFGLSLAELVAIAFIAIGTAWMYTE